MIDYSGFQLREQVTADLGTGNRQKILCTL